MDNGGKQKPGVLASNAEKRAEAGGVAGHAAKPARNTRLAPIKQLSSLRMVFNYVPPYKWILIGGLFALLVSSAFTLGIVRSLEWLIDGGLTEDATNIDPYFIAVFIAIALLGVATFFRVFLITLLGERVIADLRKAVHANLLGLSPSYFETNRPSEIASRLTTDTTLIQAAVSAAIPVALHSGIQAIGALVLIILFDPLLVLAALGLALMLMLPVTFFGRKIRTLSRTGQKKIADVGALANESYGAIQVVQAFNREEGEVVRFSERVESAYAVAKKRIMARSSLVFLVTTLVYGFLAFGLWMGVKAVIAGSLTGGELATLLALGMLVATSLANLSEVFSILQRSAGAAARLTELLSTKTDLPQKEKPSEITNTRLHTVVFDDVSFAYPSKPGVNALNNFSMNVEPGKMVAIVGQTGAGKSTVLQLLLRFFDPRHGSIKLDGVDVRDLDIKRLRSLFAFVPQDVVILADTIEANVRFGRPDATEEEVWDALEAAHCTDFIKALPDGLKTYLGERGVRLSGGQRQRLSIARAILRDAPILLLDEATSSLDSEVESEVQDALDRLMVDRTTLVIAHRLSTVRKADKIIVMDEGKSIALGTHRELLDDGGLYARLAKLQFTDTALQEAV